MLAMSAIYARVRIDAAAIFKTSIAWLIPMALTAGFTAYLSYFYNQKANMALVVQQQRLSDLQEFRQSGAGLDQALSFMSDALVDSDRVDEGRRKMQDAITRQISDTTAIEHILGKQSADQYIHGLANLRETVDSLNSTESGQALWQQSINLMSERRKLVSHAQLRLNEA
jgi:hypothetical protein